MRIAVRVLSTVAVLLAVSATAVLVWGWHVGYRVYVVHTGSMEPGLRPGDAVLDRPAPSYVRTGEVVTFAAGSGPDAVVTHRVASYRSGIVRTKGDANETADPWALHLSQVVGTVAAVLPRAGYLVVYLRQPQGLASVLTVLLTLTLLWGVFFPADGTGARGAVATERGELSGQPAAAESRRRSLLPHRRPTPRHRAF